MSSLDGSDGSNENLKPQAEASARSADSLLLESLIFVLIEKGVLTKNNALSAIQTAAQVRGAVVEGATASAQTAADLIFLDRLYRSFELLRERPGVVNSDSDNVHRLRPPVHGDRPRFPRDD